MINYLCNRNFFCKWHSNAASGPSLRAQPLACWSTSQITKIYITGSSFWSFCFRPKSWVQECIGIRGLAQPIFGRYTNPERTKLFSSLWQILLQLWGRGKLNHPQGLPSLRFLIFRRPCHSFVRRKWVLKTVAASGQNEILMNLGQQYSRVSFKCPVLSNNLVWNSPKSLY